MKCKIQINKNLRYFIGCLCTIILLGLFLQVYRLIKIQVFSEEKIPVYAYKSSSEIENEVFFLKNPLFDDSSNSGNNIYFTEFIDYINCNFKVMYEGNDDADLAYDYEIIALMEGFNREGNTENIVWKKNFQILHKKEFKSHNKSFDINEEIIFKPDSYNEIAKNIIEASKVRVSTKLSILMNVNLTATTSNGIIRENFTPTIIIPLEQSHFIFQKNNVGEKNGAIEQTIQVELPPDKSKIILYAGFIGIIIGGLVFIFLYTNNAPPKSKSEKILNKIFKNHKNRLVALVGEMSDKYDCIYRVRTIDDLVRIADEIEKPIMYQYSKNLNDITEFIVEDEKVMYMLDLKSLLNENEKNIIEQELDSSMEV